MSLIESFKTDCVVAHSSAPNKEALLKEIAALAKKSPGLASANEDAIFNALKDREALGSTGFQDGIAIPHCLLPGVEDFSIGLITHKEGIDFEALDGNPTSIIPFIIGPQDQRTMHIRLLSAISRILSDKNARKELHAATNPTVLAESFLRNIGDTFLKDKSSRRNLITVHVQNDDMFSDILQLFSEVDDCFTSVVNAHDSSEFLNAMPLFAGFWNENKKGFHKIIYSTIKHSMANEILRRLDTLVGGFENQKGVMVQMQELLYAAGSLEI